MNEETLLKQAQCFHLEVPVGVHSCKDCGAKVKVNKITEVIRRK